MCTGVEEEEVAEGFGRGRGKRPLRALTAAAVATTGYSPSKPGCLLTLPVPVNAAGLVGGNLGGSPSKDLLQLTPGWLVAMWAGVLLVAAVYWWYLEDTEERGAEHSDGAVDGGVEVGVIIAAQGSNPRL